jgi:iron(III) transport system permease protein
VSLPFDIYGERWTLSGAHFEGFPAPPAGARWQRFVTLVRSSWLNVFYIPLFLLLFVLLVWPLVMLTVGAFSTASPLEGGGEWTLSGFAEMWAEINVSNALTNTLIYAALTTFFAVSIALILCFLSERTDTPLRRLITPVVLVCAATSTLFYAIGYSLLANRFTGVINVAAQNLFGVQSLLDIESWPGLVFVDSLHAAAFLYLFLVGPFSNMDRSLEEAALAAGASRLRTFFTVNVQLLRPILSSVVLMGIIIGIKSFSIPLILGTPADISFLTVRILRTLQAYEPPHYAQASALALALTVFIGLLLYVQHRVVGRRSYVTLTGKSFRRTRWELGAWRWLAALFVLTYALLGVVLPLGAIVFSSFLPFPGVYDSLSLVNYRALFANPDINRILLNTALGASGAGLAGVALAFTIAYLTSRSHPALAAVLRGITQLQLAMPGLVGSLALIWAVASLPGIREIYGTVWLLVLAFAIGVLPISVQIAASAVRQVARELEDAARISGASPLRSALQITARLLLPSLLFAWLLAMIAIVGDLDAPLLLSSAGTRTMSIHIYKLFDGVDQAQAAALLSLLLAFIVISVALFAGLQRLVEGRKAHSLLTGEAA